MALCASGAMSLGGSTAGRSVNLELGCSATASINMNRSDVRTLAEVSSGAISMSNFYGKSSAPPPPTTLGTYYTDHGGYYTGTHCGYYLFASSVNAHGYQWKTTNTYDYAFDLTASGYSCTYAYKNSAHPLFNYVGGLTTAGFSDWYVGGTCELQQQYTNPQHMSHSTTLLRIGIGLLLTAPGHLRHIPFCSAMVTRATRTRRRLIGVVVLSGVAPFNYFIYFLIMALYTTLPLYKVTYDLLKPERI